MTSQASQNPTLTISTAPNRSQDPQARLGASGLRQGGSGPKPGPATFSRFWGLRQITFPLQAGSVLEDVVGLTRLGRGACLAAAPAIVINVTLLALALLSICAGGTCSREPGGLKSWPQQLHLLGPAAQVGTCACAAPPPPALNPHCPRRAFWRRMFKLPEASASLG